MRAWVAVAALCCALAACTHRAREQPAVRLMVVGDATTSGDNGDFTWRYRLWQHLSGSRPAVDLVGDYSGPKQGSYAAPGWDGQHQATWDMVAAQEKSVINDAVDRNRPDCIVLDLGTNDLNLGADPAAVIEDMTAIVDRARDAQPAVKLLLVKILPRDKDDERTREYNTGLEALARTMSTGRSPIAVADGYSGVDPAKDLYDGTHPNRIGEYKVAAAVARGLWQAFHIGSDYPTVPAVDPGPDPPTGVVVFVQDRAAIVSWSPTPTATSYNVYMRDSSAAQSDFRLVQFGITDTHWRQTLLFNGHLYEYRITALRFHDESKPSATVSAIPTT
jgi:hypothetical protein